MTTTGIYAPHYRLTRRGRLVVLALGLLLALAIGMVFAGGSVATGENEHTRTVVVAPGDTLWDIASDAAGHGDVVEMMRHIEDLNGLDTVDLAVGERIQIPAG